MIPHTAFAKRTEQGWIGVYTYPKDGVAHTIERNTSKTSSP